MNEDQLEEIFDAIWNTGPLTMIEKMYHWSANFVDFKQIYCNDDDERSTWQEYTKENFVWFCSEIYFTMIRDEYPRKSVKRTCSSPD